jgi:hypothetical protein
MSFENQLNSYLLSQIQSGAMVDANLTGVNEDKQVGDAIASFSVQGQIKQKKIFLRVVNGQIVWEYLSPMDENELNYTTDDWNYPNFAKRIIAPISLIMDDIGVKMYGWFQINGLPTVTRNNNVYLYCNTILPEHQQVVDNLQGIITIEDRP